MGTSIAVISDIHSNRIALEAVLQDITGRNIHRIVNLGDSLFGPIDPLGTAELLMANENIVHIMGNCDEILLESHHPSATFQFVKPRLHSDIDVWIRSFRASWDFEDLLFCHGTPYVNHHYLMEEVGVHGVRLKSPQQLAQELVEVTQRYIFCGHSHVFKALYLPDGKLVVNAGSVGLPAYDDELPYPHVMESGTPHADYVIAHQTQDGWRIEHVMVPYDWDRASAIAREHGREDYAYALRTGRALA